MITNALSVDVEEYYHGMEFEAAFPGERRGSLPSRVESSVDQVLALLADHECLCDILYGRTGSRSSS